jgi:hypothetical protein
MGDSAHSNAAEVLADPSAAACQLIDALRLEGAHRFDPVRFHYIEALAHRASAHQGRVKHILDQKLADAALALRERFDHAQNVGKRTAATSDSPPHRNTLGDLVRQLEQHAPRPVDGDAGPHVARPAELKSVRYFRNTWSRLSAEKKVANALDQAPKNAGPINSHVVALRSLALMRDTSPDYLNRFMSYVDTLLCLDQGNRGTPPAAKAPRRVKGPKPALPSAMP